MGQMFDKEIKLNHLLTNQQENDAFSRLKVLADDLVFNFIKVRILTRDRLEKMVKIWTAEVKTSWFLVGSVVNLQRHWILHVP